MICFLAGMPQVYAPLCVNWGDFFQNFYSFLPRVRCSEDDCKSWVGTRINISTLLCPFDNLLILTKY